MVKIIEHYTLHEQIGEGEYGKVFRGVDRRTQEQVAVKVIAVKRFKENPKLEECTLNEMEVLAKVKSPHIVAFREILKTVNNFYFFYEYCEGGTLDQLIRRQGPLAPAKIQIYLNQLLQAFQCLTSHNIMHRDLKPTNILLHNGSIKLGDFGFCKSLSNQRDLAQTMLGSPIYMAPEVLRGEIYTIKADIWSLGVVLYEMAYGFCPYQESSIARLINLLDHQPLALHDTINPLSIPLKQTLNRMLVKDHFKRISWEELYAMHLEEHPRTVEKVPLNAVDPNSSYNQMPSGGKEKPIMMRKRTVSTFGQEGKTDIKSEIKTETKIDIRPEQEENDGVMGLLELADAIISFNHNPLATLLVALGIYKLALKQHQKLTPNPERQTQQTALKSAISQIDRMNPKAAQQLQTYILELPPKHKALKDLLSSHTPTSSSLFQDFPLPSIETALREAQLISACLI